MAGAQFRVLSSEGAQAVQWTRMIQRLPEGSRDIHFLPEYGRIYRAVYGHEPLLAVYEDGDAFVIQPFVKRRLNELPFLKDGGIFEARFDIANAYGYGGPVASTIKSDDTGGLICAFEEAFLSYCRDACLAAEFTSLHPRLGGSELLADSGTASPASLKEVVYIDLGTSREQRWRALRKGHKSSINKALREGIVVEKVTADSGNLEELNRLYYKTMRRNRAQQRWFFPRDYFERCIRCLGEHRCSLFLARKDEATAAASILMHDFDTAYYHFSGSDARYAEYGAGTLLVFEMAQWAAEAGYRWFHLGGGVSSAPEDSLFRFKSGFSDVRAELRAYGRVLDPDVYEQLCQLKLRHEARTGVGSIDCDYFPMYRR